jgi:hypothetical protein
MRSGAHSFTQRSQICIHKQHKAVSVPCAQHANLENKQETPPRAQRLTAWVTNEHGVVINGDCLPGQRVSVDHFVCSTRGRRFNTHGASSDESQMFMGGCLFYDHATKYVHVSFHTHLNSHETQ